MSWLHWGPLALAGALLLAGTEASAEGGVRHVAAGFDVTCTVDAQGRPGCFGSTYPKAHVPRPDARFTTLTLGGHEACGLLVDKRALCFGQCGELCSPPPGPWDEIAVGSGSEACALAYPSTARCWGFLTPWKVRPPSQVPLHGLVVGESFACALDADGKPRCWGDRDPALPTAPDVSGLRMLAATRMHVCAIDREGALRCWGLGPLRPPQGRYTQISGHWEQFCALSEQGRAHCFGRVKGREVVASEAHGQGLRQVSVGQNHACGVDDHDRLECWGEDVYWDGEGLLPSRSGTPIDPAPWPTAAGSSVLDAGSGRAEAAVTDRPDAGRRADEAPPSTGPLAVVVDGTRVPIRFAAARTRGERAVEVVLSTHPLSCESLAKTWRPLAEGELQVDLVLAPMLLEPLERRHLRVKSIGWTGPTGASRGGGIDPGPWGFAEFDRRAMQRGRPARLGLRRDATFQVGSRLSHLTMNGTIAVAWCAEAVPAGERSEQPDVELTVGGTRVPLASATLIEGARRTLVLASGPQQCGPRPSSEAPWDVVVRGRFAMPRAQVTLSGHTLPMDLGVLGDGVTLREVPSADPKHVDVEIALPPDPSRPWSVRGIAHALRCPP